MNLHFLQHDSLIHVKYNSSSVLNETVICSNTGRKLAGLALLLKVL